MSCSLLKCCGCKERYPRDDMLDLPKGRFHSFDCAARYGRAKARESSERALKKDKREKKKEAKEFDQKTAKMKKEFNSKDVRWQHKNTQPRFNRMRVLQELAWFSERGIEPYCISCLKTNMDWCCGHFKTVGAQGVLRYDPQNTYLQCNRYCNMGLSGNISGNKNTIGYVAGLAHRFGADEAKVIIDYCESNSAVKKWRPGEVEEIRSRANEEVRRLERDQ